MLFADIGDFPYNVVLLLHLLAVIVAFAPAFVWPVVRVTMRKAGTPTIPESVGRHIAGNNFKVYGPALVVSGVFGALMILLSGDRYQFSDTWVSTAFVLWFLMLAVLFALLAPAERKAAHPEATPGADARVNAFGGMVHLLLLLQLIVMIWKPGA